MAIVIGARGFEIKAGRFALVFPGHPPRVEAAAALEPGEIVLTQRNPGLAQYVETGDASRLLEPAENVLLCRAPEPIRMCVLPDTVSPAEVYS